MTEGGIVEQIAKITTGEDAARVFNGHAYRGSRHWEEASTFFYTEKGISAPGLFYPVLDALSIANHLSGYYDALEAERDSLQSELERQRYVPGEWRCRVCSFHLHTMALRASDGAVGIDDKPVTEPCPNDGAEMHPLSWKELSDQQAEINIEMFEELKTLRDDRQALGWLQHTAETAFISICFELDGGFHVTVEPVGGQQFAARNQDTIRDGIKRLMEEGW